MGKGKRQKRRERKAEVKALVEQWRRDLYIQHLREHFPEQLPGAVTPAPKPSVPES